MFKLKLNDNKDFISIIEFVDNLLLEIQLNCDSDGIRGSALNKSHVAFINIDFQKTFFEEYICDEPISLGVDTGELLKVLKRISSKDEVTLSLSSFDALLITAKNESIEREFEIRLIEMEDECPEPPSLHYEVPHLLLPFELLKNSLKDSELYGEDVRISVNDDNIFFETEGTMGHSKSKYPLPENSVVESDVSSKFSIEMLNDFIKTNRLSEDMFCDIGNDKPLNLFVSDETDSVGINYLVAPKIDVSD